MSKSPTPSPGEWLYQAIIGALKGRGIKFQDWCRSHGLNSQNVRSYAYGINSGPQSAEPLEKLIDDAGSCLSTAVDALGAPIFHGIALCRDVICCGRLDCDRFQFLDVCGLQHCKLELHASCWGVCNRRSLAGVEVYLLPILENGGPLGALVVAAVLLTGFLLRQKGWLTNDKAKVVSSTQLIELTKRVGDIDSRLKMVEHEIDQLPTRAEIHELQLAHEKLAGRMLLIENTTSATKAGVMRIEDFMINYAKGNSK